MKTLEADVAIIGGGFGAVAATLALLQQGRSVVIIEEYPWIGGQVTSQALCVLDDYHDPSGETTGISRSYAEFRRRVRDAYQTRHPLSAMGAAQLYLNPGQSLCSHLSAEPHMAYSVISAWLEEETTMPGQLQTLTGYKAVSFERQGPVVRACTVCPAGGDREASILIHAGFFLDGTETGETYPLLNIPFRTGSEARHEFDEPHAPETARPDAIQSFTLCLAAEFIPGGDFRIPKPAAYERWRDRQHFSLFAPGADAGFPAGMFEARTSTNRPYVSGAWYYRSVRDTRNFQCERLSARTIFNVSGNDYHDAPYLGRPGDRAALAEARHLTRCYLYWLQHEAPRDDGGNGYPEIRSVPEMTGTPDGIAMAPYIREGRRLSACTTVTERDLHAQFWPGARARPFRDSIGLGSYWIDIHRTTSGAPGLWEEARPYQIPLGSLVSPALQNFAVANKGIGVTQIANGAYRLHPVEWAIGEAAGMLADEMLGTALRHPNLQGRDLQHFQRKLVDRGIPLYWYEDVPFDLPSFPAVQLLAVEGVWPGCDGHLRCSPHDSIDRHRTSLIRAVKTLSPEANLEEIQNVYLTAHNARKHDVMHVMDRMRQDGRS
jgi:hypothetical protein